MQAHENNNQNLKCTFVDGVILLVFNPKAYVIISLMFTIFLDGSQSLMRIILITQFTVNNCLSFTLWTLFGDLIGAKFRNENIQKY